MAWFRPRAAAPPPPSAPVDFDAVIDLDPAIAGHDGAAAVADAVRAMPGARWISVEAHATRARVAVEVMPPGVGAMPDDEAWRALRDRVERVARSALAHAPARSALAHAPPPRPAASFAFPVPAGSGFAEVTPAALTLLEQLASSHAAPPRSSEGPSDLDALGRLLGLVLPADPRATAAAALARFGSMAGVLAASEGELRAVPGLGTQCVAAIKLVHEAALRLARAGVSAQPLLEDRGRLRAYLAAALAREPVEQFRILFLDDRGRLQADEVQGRGTVNHTPVYPREVIRRATELNAAAIVLVHNHPSGDPAPSRDDLDVTRRIALVADAFGIELRDHLIIGNGRWFSFREQGLLDEAPLTSAPRVPVRMPPSDNRRPASHARWPASTTGRPSRHGAPQHRFRFFGRLAAVNVEARPETANEQPWRGPWQSHCPLTTRCRASSRRCAASASTI